MMVLGVKLDPVTVGYMAFNFVAAVGIVFCNKYVFHLYHFDFATFITALHFFGEWWWPRTTCFIARPSLIACVDI
jgi:uncharacterized integral membrane protein